MAETKEVRMEVDELVAKTIKDHFDEWKGRPFEELEAFVKEKMSTPHSGRYKWEEA